MEEVIQTERNEGGRPTKLTPELQTKICDIIRVGNYASVACKLVGITEQTLYSWLKRGTKGESPFKEFMESVELAEGLAEAELLTKVRNKTGEDWRAAMNILSRRWPARWAKREIQIAEGELPISLSYVPAKELLNEPKIMVESSPEGSIDGS
jgi:hypothetical protein